MLCMTCNITFPCQAHYQNANRSRMFCVHTQSSQLIAYIHWVRKYLNPKNPQPVQTPPYLILPSCIPSPLFYPTLCIPSPILSRSMHALPLFCPTPCMPSPYSIPPHACPPPVLSHPTHAHPLFYPTHACPPPILSHPMHTLPPIVSHPMHTLPLFHRAHTCPPPFYSTSCTPTSYYIPPHTCPSLFYPTECMPSLYSIPPHACPPLILSHLMHVLSCSPQYSIPAHACHPHMHGLVAWTWKACFFFDNWECAFESAHTEFTMIIT